MDGLRIACNSIMRLNESERKQRPFIPSQKTMALLVEAFGMITWADVSMVHATVWNSDRRGRRIMYLHHKVVEFFLSELRFLMAGPRVLATRTPIFGTIRIIAIAARVGDGARRAQQVDHQLGIAAGRTLQE